MGAQASSQAANGDVIYGKKTESSVIGIAAIVIVALIIGAALMVIGTKKEK